MSKSISNRIIVISVVVVGLLFSIVGLFYSSFALLDPMKSISFTSENLNYDEKDSGSWKIENSAEWIEKGKARITVKLDTIERVRNRNTDMIFVLDISGSMAGEKLSQAKSDIKELFSFLLEVEGNQGALITFDQDSTILSDFTSDKEQINNLIDGLYDRYTTNYYQALVNVGKILENYQYQEDRDLVVVFMTDGLPNEDTPNEVNYFKYLKDRYPYITVNAVQYEMGNSILESVKDISDNQYIANIKTLKEVLFKASVVPVPYSRFRIENLIDREYFMVEKEEDIKIDKGRIVFDKENQRIEWNLDNLASGSSSIMTIDIRLKEEYVNQGGVYPTNKSIQVESRIENDIESIENKKTPRLKNEYQVSYDGNLPEGCVVENIPGSKNYFTYDSVEIEEEITCEGYQFRGWKIVTENVNRPTESYFIMPESDVVLRGEWTNLSIAKSIDGTINNYVEPVLQRIGASNYNKEIWKYKDSITKIVIQDQIRDIKEATETFDLSEGKNYGVVGYIVPNTEDISVTTYTAYIQGEGKIKANKDSSYLFYNFKNVEVIEGLEYLDTSNVTNMQGMFASCNSLLSIDLSNFDTSNVTNFQSMFSACGKLKELDVSSFNTSNLTNMHGMFQECSSLIDLDVSHFDTSKVTSLYRLFYKCNNLINIDVSHFDTSNVTDMSGMFWECQNLTSLDLSHFDTSKVTNMSRMFTQCQKIKELDLSNFDTSKVTDMAGMFAGDFYNQNSLTSLDISGFDTSKVTNMSEMFLSTSLVALDLSHFDTSKLTNMYRMFRNSSKLTNLNVSNFDTSNISEMVETFTNCNRLTQLDLSSFDTSSVTNMSSMFSGCSSLINLDFSNFDTSEVFNMYFMFNGCSSLKSLNLNSFNTINVNNMQGMFQGCSSLVDLNLENFNTFSILNMQGMFRGCSSLVNLDLSNFINFNLENVQSMFENCKSLVSLNLNNFNTSSVTDMRYMFSECSSLASLNLSGFDTSNVVDMRYMFNKCSALESLDLSSFDTSSVTNMEYMFNGCNHLSTTITIFNPNLTGYTNMFMNASIVEETNVTVNYIDVTSDFVDLLIATKSSNSNVVKGVEYKKHLISLNNSEIQSNYNEASGGQTIQLIPVSETNRVISFSLNGVLVQGDSFVMPDEDVLVTNVRLGEIAYFETNHQPFSAILDEKTFEGATSLTVVFEVETRNQSTPAGLYFTDSTGKIYGKYWGNRRTRTIVIPGNYLKVEFKVDGVMMFYYGARVEVYANYD